MDKEVIVYDAFYVELEGGVYSIQELEIIISKVKSLYDKALVSSMTTSEDQDAMTGLEQVQSILDKSSNREEAKALLKILPTKLLIKPVDLTRALKVMNGKRDNKNEPQA